MLASTHAILDRIEARQAATHTPGVGSLMTSALLAIRDLIEAIRYTQEYAMLPAIEGWSWYDALVKHAPDVAATLRADWERAQAHRPTVAHDEGTLGKVYDALSAIRPHHRADHRGRQRDAEPGHPVP